MRRQTRWLLLFITLFTLSMGVSGLGGPVGAATTVATAPYLEQAAFSAQRLAEGKAAFEQKCAVCHTPSGRDMVAFGNPDFNWARVAGSVKKFAGATQDPELGEKVYEYLRAANPGPFQNQHDPFLQPGPLAPELGVFNPVLTERTEFWGALTGHKAPTPEDVALTRIWDSYEWPKVIVPFELLSWSQFMPHSVPLADARKATELLLAKQKINTASLPLATRGLGAGFNSGIPKILNTYQFTSHDKEKTDHTLDELEGVNAASYLNWLAVLDFEYAMPQWRDGGWNGEWAFGPAENPILWKAGAALVHLDIFAANPEAKVDSRTLNRHLWTWYPNMYSTGKTEIFKPSAYFYAATINWSCRIGDTGRYGGSAIQTFSGLKHLAELWNHSQTYPGKQYPGTNKIPHYGEATRRYLISIWTPYVGMKGTSKTNRAAVVNPLLEVVYQQWKASIGATDSDLRAFPGVPEYELKEKEAGRWSAMSGAYALVQDLLSSRQRDFVKAYVRRLYPDTAWNGGVAPDRWDLFKSFPAGPVILPFGSTEAVAGEPYRLRILRTQAYEGDVGIRAADLPPGARLVRTAGNWERDDFEYAIEWTPTAAQAGASYTVRLTGESARGTDETSVTIRVQNERPAPVLDAISDRIVYVGQELSFPLTVGSYEGKGLTFSAGGSFGQVIPNAWQTAGLYTVKPTAADVGVQGVTFTVTDSQGRQSSQTAKITVIANQAPTATLSPIGSGPGSNKNIYRARVGETLRIAVNATDPDGDPLEILKNPDFPGTIRDKVFTYTVTPEMAKHFPGPNVLTFTIRDVEKDPARSTPANPRHKGGEQYKVLLVYFEAADADPNHTPWAVAGGPQTVRSGAQVALDGSGSDDTDGDRIRLLWEQVEGPKVTLSDPTAARPTFTAPGVGAETILKFYLTATDPAGLSDRGVVRVKVTP